MYCGSDNNTDLETLEDYESDVVNNGTDNGDTENTTTTDSKIIYKDIVFAHPSEAQCAKILDFYNIFWQYEPTTFPIEWDDSGNVTQSFSPDFYLPEFDLYIELTTMSQKLVTKKNRKVRKLRELYPHIKIKIFYQRDFKHLLLKFGLPGNK